MERLHGRNVLVTGGVGAIGAAIFRRVAEEGEAGYITGKVNSVSGGVTMAG